MPLVSAPHEVRRDSVKILHSTISVATSAILQWILFAQTLGVSYEMLVETRELVNTLDAWCQLHPADQQTSERHVGQA